MEAYRVVPFIGFNLPSHTHDVIAFIHRIIAKGLSETVSISDDLVLGKFLFKAKLIAIKLFCNTRIGNMQ